VLVTRRGTPVIRLTPVASALTSPPDRLIAPASVAPPDSTLTAATGRA